MKKLLLLIFAIIVLTSFGSAYDYTNNIAGDALAGSSQAGFGATAYWMGMSIIMKTNASQIEAEVKSTTNCTTFRLLSQARTTLAETNITYGTYKGNLTYNLVNGTSYYVTISSQFGSNCVLAQSSGTLIFPFQNTSLTWNSSNNRDSDTINRWNAFTNLAVRTGEPDSAVVSFTFNAPLNSTTQIYPQINVTINTTSSNIGGTLNTSHYIYSTSGSLIQRNEKIGSANYVSNFSNLAVGTYFINATVKNETYSNSTEKRTIYIINNASVSLNAPINQTTQFYTNPHIIVNTTQLNFGSSTNVSHRLYNSSGVLIRQNNGTNGNYVSNFSNLAVGTYLINATATDGVVTNTSITRTFHIYNLSNFTIIRPANLSSVNRDNPINITYTNVSINPVAANVSLSFFRIDLLNQDGTFNRTITSNNSLNLTYQYNITNNNTIRKGNYTIRVNLTDSRGNIVSSNNGIFTLNNTAPTTPSFNLTPTAFYYNYISLFSANNSQDVDGDAITYLYQVRVNGGEILQSYSSTSSYTPSLSDVGKTLNISVKASTSDANSSETSFTRIVYLTLANFYFIREKTNTPFNISTPSEISLSVICTDDVNTFNVSSANLSLNITCAYKFIKVDVNYGNGTSYFRIINPSFSAFANTSIYLLDLFYDTAIEKIITINDLTGSYANGSILVDRFINGTQVNIISQPLDIESSADLFLLKDALYTITVVNTAGELRVLGNLIASAAGSSTLTLPDLEFTTPEAVLGGETFWNYSYSYNGTGFIQLDYTDGRNDTNNLTFSIKNESNRVVFQIVLTKILNGTTRAIINYAPLQNVNFTYISELQINHGTLGLINETRVFTPPFVLMVEQDNSSDFLSGMSNVIFWLAIILVIVIGLSFDARTSHVGLVVVVIIFSMFVAWSFIRWGAIGSIMIGILGIVAAFNFITRSRKETGGD